MPSLDVTEKKLREATYFLRLMSCPHEPGSDPEHFDFLMSAFLSAARSAYCVLREYESNDRTWVEQWPDTLARHERDLFDECTLQRNKEVHRLGAEVIRAIKYVPFHELKTPVASTPWHPAYGHHWTGPPGTPPPKFGVPDRQFTVGAGQIEVSTACGRYLALLRRMVEDFKAAHP